MQGRWAEATLYETVGRRCDSPAAVAELVSLPKVDVPPPVGTMHHIAAFPSKVIEPAILPESCRSIRGAALGQTLPSEAAPTSVRS